MDAIGEGAVKYIPGAGGINGIAQRDGTICSIPLLKSAAFFAKGNKCFTAANFIQLNQGRFNFCFGAQRAIAHIIAGEMFAHYKIVSPGRQFNIAGAQ